MAAAHQRSRMKYKCRSMSERRTHSNMLCFSFNDRVAYLGRFFFGAPWVTKESRLCASGSLGSRCSTCRVVASPGDFVISYGLLEVARSGARRVSGIHVLFSGWHRELLISQITQTSGFAAVKIGPRCSNQDSRTVVPGHVFFSDIVDLFV